MCKNMDQCMDQKWNANIYIHTLSNLPGGPAIGLGKTGGLIPGSNGELPGICAITGVGRTGRRGL